MARKRIVGTLAAVAVTMSGWAFAQDAAKIERGKAVFAERKCKVCHSIAGEGNSKGSLDGVGKLGADEVKQWLLSPKEMAEKAKAARKPPMKAFTDLPPGDMDALVAYLLTLQAK